MIRSVKPKNARAKRALEKKAPKIVENVKTALFIPGHSSTKALHDIMVDLSSLKKPDIKRFQRKNEILPFEDSDKIEFFSEKNDCSILILSTHNKKRPNNLTFIRTFNYKIYDMVELSILQNFKLFQDFKKQTFNVGLKPMFVFNGANFDNHVIYKQVKSLFLDLFRGEVTNLQDVLGLQYVISISAAEVESTGQSQDGQTQGQEQEHINDTSNLPIINFRVYKLKTYKSTEPKLPRCELEEVGPRFDFKIGRYQSPSSDMEKEAHMVPKQLQTKERKNINTDDMGDKVAKIHVGTQDLAKLQTRKMKGLKSKYDQMTEEDEQEEEGADEYEDEIVSEYEEEDSSNKRRKI
ncbi:unnamed protein product [[Candida] boidinii]|uniref:Ribosome production factor 2 homolog n=1 Tax=Candida boidinii TaxID=5477 RepID=A0A9W6WEC4_CANBO|nr:hypothetical protein BVG19_g2938 [[Candida] boidinii]OWB50401.1 hypothetical protein B5S27_g1951 [[Candida] boidinii]OWB66587.1 hypothetical protein B5S30_g1929 [[Candida] boidinii]OWB83861.1 hypothetical protein B5S33_g2496 [[Candida] boidinii]GME67378.1 unnamed protein product [[Candida] boidinii]